MSRKRIPLFFISITILFALSFIILSAVYHPGEQSEPQIFSGENALKTVAYQINLGPRIPGSDAHQKIGDWIVQTLKGYGWQTEIQQSTYKGQPVRNIIARRGSGKPWMILGAHYDTRMAADQDPDTSKRAEPVPGANDGASGVSVLLELGRTLPENLDKEIWLVFFDSEDQGNLPDWDWILGSRAFAEQLSAKPDAVVIVDMIGDADLNIYQERNSNQELVQSIWKKAAELGYSKQFIPQLKYGMLDDHTPFLEKGIAAADIIDFDYPYWHTTSDTTEKVSAESLKIVGETLYNWITSH
jgi:Zn-dependent M28 family amino/carboxypeptidase